MRRKNFVRSRSLFTAPTRPLITKHDTGRARGPRMCEEANKRDDSRVAGSSQREIRPQKLQTSADASGEALPAWRLRTLYASHIVTFPLRLAYSQGHGRGRNRTFLAKQ